MRREKILLIDTPGL